jgi:PQQ-like domain
MRTHRLRGIATIVLALALSGCWLQAGGGAANTRFNAAESSLTRDNVTTLAEKWRVPVDSIVTEPILSGDRIYVATRKYGSGALLDVLGVQAYDRDTGALVWEQSLLPTGGPAVSGDVATPALRNGVLWVPYWHDGLGPCAGGLARLDAATGTILGTDATGAGSSPVVTTGSILASTERGCGAGAQLVVRDVTTRDVLWTHTFPAGSGVATPTIANGRLFLLTGGALYAFAADGCGTDVCAPLWSKPGVGSTFDFLRPAAGPGGTLVTVGTSSGPGTAATIVVRDAATGNVRWQAEPRYTGPLPGAITGFAVAYDTVYVAGARSEASSFDPTAMLDAYPAAGCGQPTCAPAWTADLGPTRPSREPTVAGGVVYVPLVATASVAPAIVAVDAHGCDQPACPELVRVPLVAGSGIFIAGPQPYVTSVGAGRVVLGWLPGLYGPTQSQIVSLGPASG